MLRMTEEFRDAGQSDHIVIELTQLMPRSGPDSRSRET